MSYAQVINITPRAVHALWLILRKFSDPSNCIISLAKTLLKIEEDSEITELLHLGEHLDLLEVVNSQFLLTPEGKRFATAPHWRLWNAPSKVKSLFKKCNVDHFFINLNDYHNRPAIIDLFSGVGGLSLGFAAAGFNIVLAIDNDPHACEAHRLNFPETVVIQDDISNFAADPRKYLTKVPDLAQRRIVGIVGGPPCQGFSIIGERSASDERNLLTTKFIDSVLALEPDFFVMENVPGLATSGIPPTFSTYIKRLAGSNGEPASTLVDMLPVQRVGKRSRQLKKKLIGSTIRKFSARADNYFKVNNIALSKPEQIITYFYDDLQKLILVEIQQAYTDQDVAHSLLTKGATELAIIAIASAYERLLKCGVFTEKDCKDYFQSLTLMFPSGSVLHETITEIFADYESFPPSMMYKGKKTGPVLQHILERVGQVYDVATPHVLNAASYGTPQDRERLFIVGVKKILERTFNFPEASHYLIAPKCLDDTTITPAPTVRDAIGDLPDIDTIPCLIDGHEFSASQLLETDSKFALKLRLELLDKADYSLPRPSWNPYLVDCSNRTTHEANVRRRLEILKPGARDTISRKTRLHPQRLAPTLRAGTKSNKGSHTAVRPVHYAYNRVISVREGARLMGYPDWMTFHSTKWHGFRLVGNGVPFPLANAIAREIKNIL